MQSVKFNLRNVLGFRLFKFHKPKSVDSTIWIWKKCIHITANKYMIAFSYFESYKRVQRISYIIRTCVRVSESFLEKCIKGHSSAINFLQKVSYHLCLTILKDHLIHILKMSTEFDTTFWRTVPVIRIAYFKYFQLMRNHNTPITEYFFLWLKNIFVIMSSAN